MPNSSKQPRIKTTQWEILRPPLSPRFQMPTKKELMTVFSGDNIKLTFHAGDDAPERMWVTVTKCGDIDSWEGTLDNDPSQEHTASVLKYGDIIKFHPYDVIAIDSQANFDEEDTSTQVIESNDEELTNSIQRSWHKNPQIVVPAIIGLLGVVATITAALL